MLRPRGVWASPFLLNPRISAPTPQTVFLTSFKMQTRKAGTRLYNANPRGKSTLTNLGYKTRKIALNSIKKIKTQPLAYQKQTATTMYYRAKHHKYRTHDMEEAMTVYKRFLNSLSRA